MSTGNLTATTIYRASVSIGACSTVTSNEVTVALVAAPAAKTLTANTTSPTGATSTTAICTSGGPAKILTVGAGTVGDIQWQVSTTSATAGFADIAGATGTSYTITNPVAGANYYRIIVTNSCGATATGTAKAVWYKVCSAKAEVSDAGVASAFNVVASPNPCSANFNLSLTTSSDDKVGIVVYDMTGRLIEKREVQPTDMVEQQIGDRYPSGVYNVVVTQGEDVKTLRVIKR